MTRDSPPEYLSGDLRICPALGQVVNSTGESIRLGPVNMKVLEALLTRPGRVVSRSEIYEAVWGNQAVGEDALTRCVSDIRAEIRTLSGREDWIETLPKRGYRWIGEVSEASPGENPDLAEPAIPASDAPETPSHVLPGRALRLARRGAAYLVALVLMASAAVWTIDRFSDARVPVVAVLPVSAGSDQSDTAAALDLELTRYLMDLGQIRVLSRSAVESRPSNPFPFFYYEFGARWLVESDLRQVAGHRLLTISIADARTGIVELQVTQPVPGEESAAGEWADTAFAALTEFIGAQLAQ